MTETPVQTHDITDGERKFLAKYGHLFRTSAMTVERVVTIRAAATPPSETSGETS